MGYFQVVNYDLRGFIRLATAWVDFDLSSTWQVFRFWGKYCTYVLNSKETFLFQVAQHSTFRCRRHTSINNSSNNNNTNVKSNSNNSSNMNNSSKKRVKIFSKKRANKYFLRSSESEVFWILLLPLLRPKMMTRQKFRKRGVKWTRPPNKISSPSWWPEQPQSPSEVWPCLELLRLLRPSTLARMSWSTRGKGPTKSWGRWTLPKKFTKTKEFTNQLRIRSS